MLTRALIVLLIVLNAGVALWWATRPASVATTPTQNDAASPMQDGIARLQLLAEVPHWALARKPLPPIELPLPSASASPATVPNTTQRRCFTVGPFKDAQALATARARLQPKVAELRTRQAITSTARGWRVSMPPLADRAAAQAMAERLKAAGFDDYLIVSDGEEANGIALGRYGGESIARQRETALRAAGFETALAQPLGATEATWLDIAVTDAAFDPARAGEATGATRADALDCAKLR